MRLVGFALLLSLAVALVGCKSSDDNFDPNYKAEVKMSDADKQKAADAMANQSAPGEGDKGQGGRAKLPPGKH